jgi:hypothetical protein
MIHPKGTFQAVVEDHGIGESKNTGTPQVIVKFATSTEGGQDEIWGYFALTDKAAQYTVEKVRAMGFTGNDIEQLNDGQCCVGNPCSVTVEHEEYNGKVRAKVAFVNPPGDGEAREIKRSKAAGAKARMFNALLHKTPCSAMPNVETPAPSQRKPTNQNPPIPPEGADDVPADDIPF